MTAQKAFLDTEFTDFIDCQLISIGIVTEDGREFYAERTDYNQSACGSFVRAAVLPQLGTEPAVVGTAEQVKEALLSWLGQLGPVEIYVDYQTDWDLFLDLCTELPPSVTGKLGAFDPKRSSAIGGKTEGKRITPCMMQEPTAPVFSKIQTNPFCRPRRRR